jgi:hypothetical protein
MSLKSITRYHREAVLGMMLALASLPAVAQSVDAEPVDLKFTVINATTGQPGSIERLTIDYVRERRNGILDFEPAGADFVAPGVPIKEGAEYIVTAWHQGIPYWWSQRGRDLMAQKMTLHVFDATASREGARIQGLNLVIRRQDSLLTLEYMIQVDNTVRPQQTIFDRQATFEIDFPVAATRIKAAYERGPEPTPVPVERGSGDRLGLAVPLTPGLNQIQVSAVVPWHEDLSVPVGSNLEIGAWSVLVAPEWLEVVASEMEVGQNDVPGFRRLTGPPLEAGRSLDLRLRSGPQGPSEEQDLFTQGSPEATNAIPPAPLSDKKVSRPPLPFLIGGTVVIIVVIAARRRRR